MARTARMEEYRRRRHRAAVTRRGLSARLPPRPCERGGPALRQVPRGTPEVEIRLQRALDAVARRVNAYPGVAGLLYRRAGNAVVLHIVAPRPMTAPMRLLASAWEAELRTQCPAFLWDLAVASQPPEDPTPFCCLFWRRL